MPHPRKGVGHFRMFNRQGARTNDWFEKCKQTPLPPARHAKRPTEAQHARGFHSLRHSLTSTLAMPTRSRKSAVASSGTNRQRFTRHTPTTNAQPLPAPSRNCPASDSISLPRQGMIPNKSIDAVVHVVALAGAGFYGQRTPTHAHRQAQIAIHGVGATNNKPFKP